MPDRYGEKPDPQTDTDACNLCDNQGRRNGFDCDHTDHTAAAKRGIALIRTQMGWKTTKTQSQPPSTHPRHNP